MIRGNLTDAIRLPTQAALIGVLALSLVLLLAACGGGEEPTPQPTTAPAVAPQATQAPAAAPTQAAATSVAAPATATPATATPLPVPTARPAVTGGTLRVAASGFPGGQFNPFFPGSWAEGIALQGVYDRFAWLLRSEMVYALAESVTPNADGTEWTIVLRDATFHDGSPITSRDAAWSIAGFSNPQMAPSWARLFGNVDAANIRIVDEKTLIVPLHSPQGDFVERTLTIVLVAPDGSVGGPDAIGSGAFKLDEFDDGKSVRMVRNEDYYGGPTPLDGLEVIYIADANARLNALKGGEVEVATQITPAGALAERDNPDVVLLPNNVANSLTHGFAANTTIPPYDNLDVVRALRLAVDRQDLVDKVLLGYGQVGNDLIGRGQPGYADSIPQIERDVEEARRLFASAGVTELTLMTAEVTAGATAAAELMVQYLAEAGVTLKLDVIPADQWFADFSRLLSRPLQTTWGTNLPPATFAAMTTGSRAGMNLTGIGGPEYDAMLAALVSEVDIERRRELSREIQEYLHANDGRIVWGFQDELAVAVPGVAGVVYNSSIPMFHLTTWER